MPEPLGGLTKSAAAKLGRVERQVLGRLPDVGRRTRRVYSGGNGRVGCEIVIFSIDSYDDASGIAVCTIEYRPYGIDPVNDESEYGTIDVIDPAGCFFNEDEADLIGRWGTASYMTPTAANDEYQAAVWVVIGLCCPAA